MSAAEVMLAVLGVLALVGVALWSVAQRLDRLHRREFQTRATLEAQLVHRADAAADLAAAGRLDPASAVLVADAAMHSLRAARLVGEQEHDPDALVHRGLAESDLTRTLRLVLAEQPTAPGPEEERVARWHDRVQLARRFHNDAVVQIQGMRRLWLVRGFGLAGRAELPTTFEMDDAAL